MSRTTDKVIDAMNNGYIPIKLPKKLDKSLIKAVNESKKKGIYNLFEDKDKCEHEYILKTSLKHGKTIMECCFCKSYYEVD